MGVNSLPKTVTRQRRGCDLNPGPSAPESSTLTTRLPNHHPYAVGYCKPGAESAVCDCLVLFELVMLWNCSFAADRPLVVL